MADERRRATSQDSSDSSDLSREAEAVRALAEAGAGLLGGVLDAIQDGAMIMHREGTVLYCNRALLEWMRVGFDEIVGRSIYDFVPMDTGLRRKQFFQRAVETRQSLHFRDELGDQWFEHRVYPILGDDGTVSSFAIYTIDVTSQQQTEDRLRAGEALLHEVLNALPVGVRVLDGKGHVIRENPAARKIWTIADSPSPEPAENGLFDAVRLYEEITSTALKGGTVLSREIDVGSDALRRKTFMQSGLPLYIEGKGIVGAVAVTEDISELRQGRELLRIQRDLAADLSAISDSRQALGLCLDVALHISGMDCGGVYVVDQQTGSLDLAVHRNLPDAFVTATSRYECTSSQACLVSAGKPVYSSFIGMNLKVPPGSDMVSLTVVPISHNGKVIACLNLSSRLPDPPEPKIRVAIETVAAQMGGALVRMHAEEERVRLAEVAASEELFRMLASNAPVGIFLTDTRGKCRYVNERWCQMASSTADRAMGLGWSGALHPDDKERLLKEWQTSIRKARRFETEQRFLRPDGRTIWTAVSAVPARDRRGRLIGYVGTVSDITERKRAEEELRNLSRHLEAAREKERRKMSREIHDELGQTLTVAKMELGLLSKGLRRDQLQTVAERVDSIRDLIDASIQTVKRISSGLRPLVLDELGLCSAIEWQAGDFQKRTGIVCEARIEPDELELDQEISTAVFRILQEALTNVVRHASAKRVSIQLRSKGGHVILEVSDNGKGIDRERALSPNSLGLIGMRERALVYGGNVEIAGTPRRGTTLLVTIPFKRKGEGYDSGPYSG